MNELKIYVIHCEQLLEEEGEGLLVGVKIGPALSIDDKRFAYSL